MIGDEQRAAVDALLRDVRSDPTRLPIESISAVRAAGVEVSVERHEGTEVVCITPRADDRLQSLSAREREVAMLAAAGYSNAQIAAALFISLATVKDHMHAALRKTGLSSRAQLIAAWYGGLGHRSDARGPAG